jgi:polar amino acid transport system substrate-binding protein
MLVNAAEIMAAARQSEAYGRGDCMAIWWPRRSGPKRRRFSAVRRGHARAQPWARRASCNEGVIDPLSPSALQAVGANRLPRPMKIAAGILALTGFLVLIGCGGGAVADGNTPASISTRHDVAPTGSLRVAIAVGPAASTFWATRDPDSGAPRGVTVELAKAAAAKLGVSLQLVLYQNSGEIAAAAASDGWDISFMPADAERERLVDQGPPYVVYESTYLVRAGSDIRAIADVDRDGIHVGAIAGTSTSRTVAKSLKHATLTTFSKPEAAAELLGHQQLDALAMGTDALIDLAKGLPGTRVLAEPVQSTGVVVTVPKNRPATREWAADFIEKAKADGTVRRAFDSAGFARTPVAPARK